MTFFGDEIATGGKLAAFHECGVDIGSDKNIEQPILHQITQARLVEPQQVVMLVAELAVTVAVMPLNITVLLAGVALKLVPVIVTVVPMIPEVGVKEVMVGDEPVV